MLENNQPNFTQQDERCIVHIEAILNPRASTSLDHISNALTQCFTSSNRQPNFQPGSVLDISTNPALNTHLLEVRITQVDNPKAIKHWPLLPWELSTLSFNIAAYRLHQGAALTVQQAKNNDDSDDSDEDTDDKGSHAFTEWSLPHVDFHGLWDALYYDTDLKKRLVSYSSSALLFSDKKVNPQIISWNRVVLLHGPPGTGKTSMCKALAQKLSISLGSRFLSSRLIEVNAHSLFSRWFSESGKQVIKLFDKIRSAISDPSCLVFVLIDEVESLAAARSAAAGEPSDAVRAVNALLTQLDSLKNYANCMVLTTSNITGRIDLAFVDRADIRAYVGNPNTEARYEILRSCIDELVKAGIILTSGSMGSGSGTESDKGEVLCLPSFCQSMMSTSDEDEEMCAVSKMSSSFMAVDIEKDKEDLMVNNNGSVMNHAAQAASSMALGKLLVRIAAAAEDFSGRQLRKLPFLAHARLYNVQRVGGSDHKVSVCDYLKALEEAVVAEKADKKALGALDDDVVKKNNDENKK